MKKTKLKVLAIVMFAIASVNVMNAQTAIGVNASTNCVPPPGGEYAAQFHAHYSNGAAVYDLTQPIHSQFTGCDPLPPAGSGGTTIHSFGSEVEGIQVAPPSTLSSVKISKKLSI